MFKEAQPDRELLTESYITTILSLEVTRVEGQGKGRSRSFPVQKLSMSISIKELEVYPGLCGSVD